uniref:Sex-determining region Y protein n=1 Tax=Syphacia muris TaxID=451379 RepID=A0A0N5AX31_9BILA
MAESCASSPSMYASDSPSPVPSASQTPHNYTNGYHSSIEFVNIGSPGSHSNHGHSQNSEDHHSFIKRPLNAYMIWTVEERKKILAKDPKMKMNDVSRIMGEKWKSLSDKEKKPYFEQSKQYKLDHKRALRENPDLLYRPQRKKPSRNSVVKQDIPMESESSTAAAVATGSAPGTYLSNGMTSIPQQRYSVPQANGTVVVAQPVVFSSLQLQSPQRTPVTVGSFQTPQSSIQRNYPSQTGTFTHLSNGFHIHHHQQPSYHSHQSLPQSLAVNPAQMLDLYYTSLCQPAFPEPGETNGMAPPQYYLDQYQQLLMQSVPTAVNHANVPAGYSVYGAM